MDNEQIEKLKKFESRLKVAQKGHYGTCSLYLIIHYVVGILLIIITAILTAISSQEISSNLLSFGCFSLNSVFLGIVSTIFASLQVFIKPSEKSETHRQCAIKYGELKRDIEIFMAYPKTDRELEEFLKNLKKNWSATAEGAPLTPKWIYTKAEKETEEESQGHK